MTEASRLPTVHTGTAGRPPYDDAVRKRILNSLKIGMPRVEAAVEAGIGKATFWRWLDDIEGFREAVEQAEAAAHRLYAGRLARRAAAGDTAAIKFWLERRRPDEYRERQSVEVSVTPEQELEDSESDGRAARLADLAREANRRAARSSDDAADQDGADDRGEGEPS